MHVVIFVTASSRREARKISSELVREKLAACVNIIDKVDSIFFWEGKLQRSKEFLLVIKSTRAKFTRLAGLVKSLHSYEVPEIIALPVIAGYKPYLRWIDASIR
ncbi:divalent-cation tolerance protein CutA [bacterium]|nr:MAG: divalent-cation tolerance protein CutA [bacterium]